MVVCTVCNGRFFVSVAAYEQHVKTSRAHLGYPCTICNTTFTSTFARSGHLSKNHQDLLCRQCNRYYLSQDSLQQHYRSDTTHPNCPQCDRGLPDNVALRVHIASAHPKPVFPCSLCDISFEDQAELEQHWKDSDRHPACLVCNIGFEDDSRFNLHIQQEHPELWCGMCGMGFASAGQLLEHYLEAESAVHPTCKMCGEGFQNQSVLDEHMGSRHPPPPPTPPPPTPTTIQDESSEIFCSVCDRTYRREEDLLRHYKESPTHPKCLSCCEGFLDEDAYQDHITDVHPAARTIQHIVETVRSPSLGAASLLTTPHRAYVSLDEQADIPPPLYGSPRTTIVGYLRDMERDLETASVASRALSEPTPVVPSTRMNISLPQQGVDEAAEDGNDEVNRSVYVTPSAEDVKSPTPSVQSLTYDSGSSTPERLESPSSIISTRSPLVTRVVPSRSPTPRSSLSVRTKSPVSPASPRSPAYDRLAQSFVTAIPRLHSVSSQQSLRSAHTASKAESVKCFSPITRVPSAVGYSPARTPSRASERSARNGIATAWPSRPPSVQYHSPRWDVEPLRESTPLRETSRTPTRSSGTPRASTSTSTSATPRSQEASEQSSTTANDGARPSPPVSPAPKRAAEPAKPATAPAAPVGARTLDWGCRLCGQEPRDPTATMCGHLFCHGCIVAELAKNLSCPVCRKAMLVRLHVERD